MIQQRITQYIEKNHLFSSDSKILVALSGGADSVALLRILHTAGYHCEAAHCNFHLRGEESNRDESFVRQLCLKYNIRLHTADFNTTQYAAEKHISIEMAARELRYNWFEEIKNKQDTIEIRNANIKVRRDIVGIGEDEYLVSDMIGFKVYDIKGDEYLGEVTEIMDTAAHDIYVIESKEFETMVPDVDVFIKNIDFENRKTLVDTIEGMKEPKVKK